MGCCMASRQAVAPEDHELQAGGRGGKDQVAPIITISYCWDAREHPDPNGVQLSLVIDTLETERHKYSTAKGDFKGFSEMGIFWDWPSLLQGDPIKAEEAKAAALRQGKTEKDAQEAADKAKRTPAEKAAFKHGLEETMDLWYAHQATTVLLLTQHPRERGSARKEGYDQSGWTTYERCSAEQIKQVWRWEARVGRRGRPGAGGAGGGGREEVAGGPGRVRPAHRRHALHQRRGQEGGEGALPPDEPRAVGRRDEAGLRRDATPDPRAGRGARQLPAAVRPPAEAGPARMPDRRRGRAGPGGGAALPARPAGAAPGRQQRSARDSIRVVSIRRIA
ncbi:unnamed protein product [Prorocentrum cordatum]|uniref:Uncharacterized protein n=1 Tax=Prorocentrum cordatum TaxID=2364126 RepID=A0ABN9QUT3_9DINO|nr:unnamed protein product [Polarella glacialis]